MASPLRAPLLLLALLALATATTPKQGLRLLGGIQDADAKEQGVKEALNFAMTEYNKASNDAYHSRALQVVKARKQIVAGVKYFLDVEIGRTTCTKAQANVALADCPFHDQPHLMRKMLCSFQIYSVPWQGKQSMTESSCKNA
ncbi:cystatin-C-like [Acomys russatus]|uniref:cystatin-C-like n=1 Tax=Acomys russatus TaxID=60746 RepID=UPI0021E247AF|nr:cystatin-C-like [Acomys russatus]